MKIARMLAAAGLVIASLGASVVADAQDYGRQRSYQGSRDRDGGYDGRDNRRDYRGYDRRDDRRDNGNHYGWRNGRGHQRCHTEWRHHRKVRVCR